MTYYDCVRTHRCARFSGIGGDGAVILLCKSIRDCVSRFLVLRGRPRGKSEARETHDNARRWCGNRRPPMQLKRACPSLSTPPRRIRSPFRSHLLSHRSPLVRRAGRRLFPLSTEQQPAIRRATPFCSLTLSRLHERATGAARGEPALKSRAVHCDFADSQRQK